MVWRRGINLFIDSVRRAVRTGVIPDQGKRRLPHAGVQQYLTGLPASSERVALVKAFRQEPLRRKDVWQQAPSRDATLTQVAGRKTIL